MDARRKNKHAYSSDTLLRRYKVQVNTEPVVSWPATNIDKRSSRNCTLETCKFKSYDIRLIVKEEATNKQY